MTTMSTPQTEPGATTSTAPTAPESGGRGASRWWLLAVACLAQLMVVLDATVVNIALPTAQADLGFSTDNRQWIVTGYALAFGSLLLLGGRIGDLVGRKVTLTVGLVGFAAASAVGGAATSFGMLLAARAGQGVFGALLAPAALSILTTTFTDAKERGRAFAIFGAIAGGGGAFGLLLGGALTEYLSWRWCLYINVPIAVAAVVGALTLLPRDRRDPDAAGIDVPGALLSVTGLVSLVYGLANAETDGWGSVSTYGFIGLGLALLLAFGYVETKVRDPLLPMGILRDSTRVGSYLSIALSSAGMFGVFLFLTYYLSTMLGYEALPTGVAFLPMIAALITSSQLAPRLVERVGLRVPVTLGFVVAAAGMWMLTGLEVDSAYATGVLPALIVVGLGLGLVMAPCMSAATDRVDPEHAGVASATVNTGQQIGGSIGTAILSAVAATAASDYLVGRDASDQLVAAQASLESYTSAFGVSALLFALGGAVAWVLLRRTPAPRDPDAAPVIAH